MVVAVKRYMETGRWLWWSSNTQTLDIGCSGQAIHRDWAILLLVKQCVVTGRLLWRSGGAQKPGDGCGGQLLLGDWTMVVVVKRYTENVWWSQWSNGT